MCADFQNKCVFHEYSHSRAHSHNFGGVMIFAHRRDFYYAISDASISNSIIRVTQDKTHQLTHSMSSNDKAKVDIYMLISTL